MRIVVEIIRPEDQRQLVKAIGIQKHASKHGFFSRQIIGRRSPDQRSPIGARSLASFLALFASLASILNAHDPSLRLGLILLDKVTGQILSELHARETQTLDFVALIRVRTKERQRDRHY